MEYELKSKYQHTIRSTGFERVYAWLEGKESFEQTAKKFAEEKGVQVTSVYNNMVEAAHILVRPYLFKQYNSVSTEWYNENDIKARRILSRHQDFRGYRYYSFIEELSILLAKYGKESGADLSYSPTYNYGLYKNNKDMKTILNAIVYNNIVVKEEHKFWLVLNLYNDGYNGRRHGDNGVNWHEFSPTALQGSLNSVPSFFELVDIRSYKNEKNPYSNRRASNGLYGIFKVPLLSIKS